MYKVMWITKFNPALEHAEAQRLWRDVHGPLMLATPGLKRYVQNHWLETNPFSGSTRSGEMDFDGHAEAWFESKEAFDRGMASEEFHRAVDDVKNCFSPGSLSSGVIAEYVMKWDPLPEQTLYRAPGT